MQDLAAHLHVAAQAVLPVAVALGRTNWVATEHAKPLQAEVQAQQIELIRVGLEEVAARRRAAETDM